MKAMPIRVISNMINREFARVIFNPASDDKKITGGIIIIDKPNDKKALSIWEILSGQKARPKAIPGKKATTKPLKVICNAWLVGSKRDSNNEIASQNTNT